MQKKVELGSQRDKHVINTKCYKNKHIVVVVTLVYLHNY